MENEKEINEIKERLISVERKLQQKSRSSKVLWFVLGLIIVLLLLCVLIGVIQFISFSSS